MINRTLPRLTLRVLDLLRMTGPAKAIIERLVRLGVPCVTPRVLRELPHDEQAFTQGLVYREGLLYESTGTATRSSLRCLDAADGSVRTRVPVPDDFAEGIALRGDRLYQLSWKSGKARVYHFPDLAKIGELHYDGEGWGLACGADGLIMSDGTSRLRFIDDQFQVTGELRITSHGLPIRYINEIEYVNGLLYANIWHSSSIFEISMDSGQVTRIIDGSALVAAAAAEDHESVMNGIAYNPRDDTFFLTGKNWKLLFEVSLCAGHTGGFEK